MNDFGVEHLTILAALRTQGNATSLELQARTGKSQATVSRLLTDLLGQVLPLGQGRSTRYALAESIHGFGAQHPLWQVDEAGVRSRIGTLSLLSGERLHVALGALDHMAQGGLPWFLSSLRAQGFLGRLLARRIGTTGLPANPETWRLPSILFAALHLHDAPGALLLGEHAQVEAPAVLPLQTERLHAALDEMALDLIRFQPAGSSAGGEQPKFLAVLESGQHVLVKFSPPRGTPYGERWHDLLHAEALAADVLSEHGMAGARCSVIRSARRSYLVSERFDRVGSAGRRHVVSVGAAHDGLLTGPYNHWAATCEGLVQRRLLAPEGAAQARTLLAFGQLIGNTDMHSGNLSLMVPTRDLAQRRFAGRFTLAPVYDMLPMRWRPNHEMGGAADYSPFAPDALNLASPARVPAQQFWARLAKWPEVSAAMRVVAAEMAQRVAKPLATMPTSLLATLLTLLLPVITACGGGGGAAVAEAPVAPAPPTAPGPALPSSRVSLPTPVAAGCGTAVAAGATVYANAEVEPYLARSSQNADHWVAVWQQDRYSDGAARAVVSAMTLDGGRSWAHTLHPFSRCGGASAGSAADFERASDPWVEIGSDGTVHVMALAVSGTAFTGNSRSAMLASRSTDGGRTYSAPQVLGQDSGAAFFNDKNSLTVDAQDANFVYAVWDRLETNGNGPTVLARSTNAGASWEPLRTIYQPVPPAGGVAQTIGNRIVVLPANVNGNGNGAGQLILVFTEIVTLGNSTTNQVRVMRSNDRGARWSAPVTVGELRAVGVRDPATGTAVRDGSIIPNIAVTPDGTLWIAWQDSRYSNGQRDAIALSRSNDGGLTWSAPVAANRDLRVPAFTPTLAVRADGLLGISHFDLRPDTADASTFLAAAWLLATRDGSNFSETPLWPLFDMAQAPNARGLFLGDYQGLVAVGNDFVPLMVLSGADLNNRSDVFTLRTTPLASSAAQQTDGASELAHRLDANQQRQRITEFTRSYMDRRLPGWSQRNGLAAQPARQPFGPKTPGERHTRR